MPPSNSNQKLVKKSDFQSLKDRVEELSEQSRAYQRKLASTNLDNEIKDRKIKELEAKVN